MCNVGLLKSVVCLPVWSMSTHVHAEIFSAANFRAGCQDPILRTGKIDNVPRAKMENPQTLDRSGRRLLY